MAEKLNNFLPKIEPPAQTVGLKLPKLKKIGEEQETPKFGSKLKLPTLKKIKA